MTLPLLSFVLPWQQVRLPKFVISNTNFYLLVITPQYIKINQFPESSILRPTIMNAYFSYRVRREDERRR